MLTLWICLWTLCNSTSYCLIWWKKEKEIRSKKKKNKPLADFKPVQWVLLVLRDAMGRGGMVFTSLPMVLRRWRPGLGFNVHSCPASGPVLHELPGSKKPLSLRVRNTNQAGAHCSTQPLSLWHMALISHFIFGHTVWVWLRTLFLCHSASDCSARVRSRTLFHSATQPLGAQCKASSCVQFHVTTESLVGHSSNYPRGKLANAWEFLTKQLPTILNKCAALPTAQLSIQSGDCMSQGPTWPNSSLLQVSPSIPISLVLASTVPVDVSHFCVSPTSSLVPPGTSSFQAPPGARLPSLLW